MAYPNLTENSVLRTDTFDTWKNKTNVLNNHSSYVESLLGNFELLDTAAGTVVNAFNEIHSEVNLNTARIGDVSSLNSTFSTSSNLVSAANDLWASSVSYTNTQVASETSSRESADIAINTLIDTIEASIGLTLNGGYIQQTSKRYISNALSLAAADGKLDDALNATQQELDTTQSSIGAEIDGTISLTGNYISGSVKTSLGALDSQVGSNAERIASLSNQSGSLQTELDNTQIGSGLNNVGAYIGTISGATSLSDADTILQNQISSNDSDIADHEDRLQKTSTTINSFLGASLGSSHSYTGTNYINTQNVRNAVQTLDTKIRENEIDISNLQSMPGVNFNPSTLHAAATSGKYSDLSETPTNLNQFTNGPGYITDYGVTSADVTAHQGNLRLTGSQITDINFDSYLTASDLTSNNTDISAIITAISGDGDLGGGTPTHPDLVGAGATTLKGADYQLQRQINETSNHINNTNARVSTVETRSSTNATNISTLTNRMVNAETSISNINDTTWSGFKIQVLANQATYDNLPSKDAGTVYFIKE